MKIDLYMDWFPGSNPEFAMAMANPGKKIKNAIRYKITVDIPDPNDPDVEIEAETTAVQGQQNDE